MSTFLSHASWAMVGIVFLIMLAGIFFQYLLSGGKVNDIKTTWHNYILSIVFCALISLFLKVPGGLLIVAFLISIMADKYFIPKLKEKFAKKQ